ncbi:MAG: AmmeMemoRadiSam system protein B [Desulfobacterales bacterium]|nr:AmmeMemoRadiSam system protein B [Desulfobacterales bacterium]MCP4161546.1 AmmeMemoRadiSam system protein B [Deltaproteobacteria bacterium]
MKQSIRKSSVAGSFYPGDADELSGMVDGYLNRSKLIISEKPFAIVSPHAGYVFSGQIAADAFKQAAGHSYETIIVLGANHTVSGFRGVSIYPGSFETPLGVTEFCEDTAKKLVDFDIDIVFDEDVHTREHSVEVQIPFIQKVFPGAKVVCAIVGTSNLNLCETFGSALSSISLEKNILIVASSDLSHFPNYEDANDVDMKTLVSIATVDIGEFVRTLHENEAKNINGLSTSACGEAPVLSTMVASKESGAKNGNVISYANSGDTEVGDKDRVVGYGAVVFM